MQVTVWVINPQLPAKKHLWKLASSDWCYLATSKASPVLWVDTSRCVLAPLNNQQICWTSALVQLWKSNISKIILFFQEKKKKNRSKKLFLNHRVISLTWSGGMCQPARDSTHIPTRQSVVSFITNGCLTQGDSVTHVAVLIPYDPEEVEAEGQQSRAQQVTQRCQVRDGKTVGIFAIPPHGVHHPVCYAQQ